MVYLGNSLQGIDDAGSNTGDPLPEKYLLFVGDRSLYKNFYLFAEAVAPLVKTDPGLRLVCVGGRPFSGQENAFFRYHGLDGKVDYQQVNDTTLAGLYRGAIAFVYPSLYEGFGIPVLEAFSCDCPAILSNTSSLPEVGGDAAAYFDPKDASSIRETVCRVVCDRGLREKMIARGRERLDGLLLGKVRRRDPFRIPFTTEMNVLAVVQAIRMLQADSYLKTNATPVFPNLWCRKIF